MLITNESGQKSFRNAFEINLNISKKVKIASGYIGASEIIKYQKKLCEIANAGGLVQIIHGMGGTEGLNDNLYKSLKELDDNLIKTNIENRVFIHRTPYHGKMYITEGLKNSNVLIGSSNFSKSGFDKNKELNFNHSNITVLSEASLFFDRLKDNSYSIDKIKLPDRKKQKQKSKKLKKFDNSVFNVPPDHSIQIRVTDASNLNLFLSKGRLDRLTKIYKPRPFYEVELTIGKKDLPRLRHYLPDQMQPVEFDAVTDLGTTFKVKFKRKTNSKTDTNTLHNTGIDFMSSGRKDGGRKQLGQYLKGKLMKNGLLKFGEPVSDDILLEYGRNSLDMYFLKDNLLYIKF